MANVKAKLQQAAEKGLISQEQVTPLAEFLTQTSLDVPRFDFTHLLYYLGGLIAIGAMTLFMTLGWDEFGGAGILTISLVYMALSIGLCEHFGRRQLAIPAGICACFMVSITPLAVFGLQQMMGWWPDDSSYREYHRYIKPLWLYMELATLAVGVMVLKRYAYPFIMLPIAITLWYFSIDIAELLNPDLGLHWDFDYRAKVSIAFGLIMLVIAFWTDLRSRKSLDYSFWLYLFGVLTFWGGLTSQESDSELGKFIYCCINLLLMGIGVVLIRRVLTVFGAIGVSFYLGHLANKVFADSWLFPISLTLIGLGIIYLGILWQKHEANLSRRMIAMLPQSLQELLAKRGS